MDIYKSISFRKEKYNFLKAVSDLFKTDNLCSLHKNSTEEYKELFKVGDDSKTIFHRQFYDKYRAGWPEFEDIYYKFIKEVIAIHIFKDQPFLYQSFPTFRVHLPNNVAVGDFHNDAEFGHPYGELNFIIPLTDAKDTASVWVESEPGKKDFSPMEMSVNEFILFNGNELTHGNKVNLTNKTRVSIDFRCLLLASYNEDNNSESITRKTKFKIGEYYKLLE